MEMKAYGYVRFIIRVNMTNELVDFSYDLPCEQCNFAALYNKGVQDGWKDPAAGTYTKQEEFSTGNAGNSGNQESYYTNSEIETVCNNYINTYNAAIPYLSNAYDLLSNDHPFLGLLSAVTGLEPFADFLTAKEAFDRLDANQMTPEQKTFYQEHKNAVNQTLLGQLIYVIENLSAMGLL